MYTYKAKVLSIPGPCRAFMNIDLGFRTWTVAELYLDRDVQLNDEVVVNVIMHRLPGRKIGAEHVYQGEILEVVASNDRYVDSTG